MRKLIRQVDEVAKARPEITKAVESMLKKGKWTVPGYRVSNEPTFDRSDKADARKEKFGEFSLL